MDVMIADQAQILGHSEDDGSMEEILEKLKDPSNKLAKSHGVASCAKRIEKEISKSDEVKDKPLVWRLSAEKKLQNALMMCGVAKGKSTGRATALEFVKSYNIGKEGYY